MRGGQVCTSSQITEDSQSAVPYRIEEIKIMLYFRKPRDKGHGGGVGGGGGVGELQVQI